MLSRVILNLKQQGGQPPTDMFSNGHDVTTIRFERAQSSRVTNTTSGISRTESDPDIEGRAHDDNNQRPSDDNA